MSSKTGVSVVVPAFNEEGHLAIAVGSVIAAASGLDDVELEVIVVDDASTDGTALVARALAEQYSFVRFVQHDKNKGFGAAFLTGLKVATREWITVHSGDNVLTRGTIRMMLQHAGKADMVCVYLLNTEHRTRLRNILSSIFTAVYTLTFNIHLRYINSAPVYSVRQLREMEVRCRRYSFPSEITVKLLRRGCTFMELAGYMNPQRKSSAMRFKNWVEVLGAYFTLSYEIFVSRRKEYSGTPTRVIPAESALAAYATAEAP
jgi:glycosyltransferase involved in cell wall biosynthesis